MLAINTILQNRYEIISVIGQGGVGAVYEARDLRLRNTVALKHLMINDPIVSKAFEHEAQLLAKLRHTSLPRVSDHFSDSQGQFLVMDYIAGDDLGLQLSRGATFSISTVLDWADQLLDALEYLHGQNPPILHRDIKPANIKITANNEVMLLDFGLAKGSLATQQLISNHSVRGYTQQYAPMEQIQGTGTDERSDLFALAATIYYLLTGKAPADVLTRAAAVLQGDPDPLIEPIQINSQIPVHVNQVLLQALALNRNQRPVNAMAMHQALQTPNSSGQTTIIVNSTATQAVTGKTVVLPHGQSIATPVKPSSKKWIGVIAVFALLFMGAIVYLSNNQLLRASQGNQVSPTDTVQVAQLERTNTISIVATNTLAPTAKPSETTQPTDTPKPTETAKPTDTPEPTRIPATSTPTADAVVAANSNMRQGPTTGYAVVGTYPQGTRLSIVGKTSDNSWLKVQTPDGNVGWIIASNLQINVGLEGVEVVVAPALPTQIISSPSEYEFAIDANRDWQDTGIIASEGKTIEFTYKSGKWTINAPEIDIYYYVDANGYINYYSPQSPIPSANVASVIGKIGNDTPFAIGISNTYTSSVTGKLYLRINDADCKECSQPLGDNEGTITMKIIMRSN